MGTENMDLNAYGQVQEFNLANLAWGNCLSLQHVFDTGNLNLAELSQHHHIFRQGDDDHPIFRVRKRGRPRGFNVFQNQWMEWGLRWGFPES